MPFLHDHGRRVPTQDVDGCIVVGMGAEAAGETVERRLAFAALPVHGSAGRTGLRGMARINLAQMSAPFFQLVGQHRLEAVPALVEDRPVQARLLAHIGSGRVHRSLGASGHVARGEVFKDHRAEAPCYVETGLVPPVQPDARGAGLQDSHTAAGLGVTHRAASAPGKASLSLTLLPFDLRKAVWHPQMRAGRERQRIRHAPVDPHSGKPVGWSGVFDLAGEGNMPAERRKAHRRVHRPAAQWSGIAELHPADLGQAHGGPFAVQRFDLDLAPLKAEGVVDPFPARGGVSGTARKKAGIGPVQIAQRLLLGRDMHGGDPVERGPQGGQFPRLRDVGQVAARLTPVVPPPVPSLLKREVVDQPHDPRELPEQGVLFGAWREPVSEGPVDHPASLSLGPRGSTLDYRTGRHVIYMLHVHLVFVTKYRRDVLSDLAIRDLHRIFAKVCRDFEAELVECGGEDDHVHLLVNYPPKVTLSKLVNSLKGVSSRLLRETRPEITGRYHKGVLWSPSYFAASCGGAPLSVIAEYVNSQREAAIGRSRVPPRPERRGIPRGER
jgi:putative transposase